MAKETAILRRDPEGITSGLVSLFDTGSVGQAIEDSGWSTSEAIEILSGIARDAANNTARERMAAVKFIEDKAEKSLTLAGIIRKVSLEALQEDGDTKKKLTAEGLQLIKAGAARTLSTLELLEAGSGTREIIDVDPVEESHECSTGADAKSAARSRPGSSDRTRRTAGSGSGNGPDRNGSGKESFVHGGERPNPSYTQSSVPGPGSGREQDDNDTTGGAEDERITRPTVEPGRGIESSGPGGPSEQHQHEHREAVEPDDWGTQSDDGPGPGRGDIGDAQGRGFGQVPRRTTPYTPGEARRRSVASRAEPVVSVEEPDTINTRRPADAIPRRPKIASRFLDPGSAATGFPGDIGAGE